MTDLIDRTALRNALYEADAVTMKGIEIINSFPAVEPKTGKWITLEFENSRLYRCSECGRSGSIPTYFCPHCGAEM